MANIIDVAQEAAVSTGTVSKYLNNTGYISPQKREKIKEAISKLNYIPNRAAKQLKECTTKDIAVVLPNLSEKKYSDLFEGISAYVDKQYRLLLFLTNDIISIETQILNDCVSNNCLGIILCTCQPSNDSLLSRISKILPIIFTIREPENKLSYNYVGFNDSQTIYSLTNQLLKLGIDNIMLYAGDSSFSNERQCIISFEQAFRNHNLKLDSGKIYSYPASKDATFRNVMNLFNENKCPEVFITTSFITAQAIKEVAYFQNVSVGEEIQIISLAEATWHDSNFSNKTINTFRNFHELGKQAVQILFGSINNPYFKEVQSFLLEDLFPCEKIQSYLKKQTGQASVNNSIRILPKLRILLNEADSGTNAMKCLIPRFIEEENISVKIDTLPHPKLYDFLSSSNENIYDIVAVDAPWIPYLSTAGLLKDLTDYINRSGLAAKMQDKVAESISSFNNRLFGLPFVYTSSLLYYRKDLFSDENLKAIFYQKYKRELLPPTTWKEFSYIAKFFTKKYNSNSPTLYGTGIFGNFPSSMMTEFYPRMWSYGGSIMDKNGFVTLLSENNIKAMQNLSETIRFSNPDCLAYRAFDSINDFMDNKIAMCANFSNNASILVDRARTRIMDNLGFSPLPGKYSVSAGWNLSIPYKNEKFELVERFINWFFSPEISSSYTVLGGSSPMKIVYEDSKLSSLYPWIDMVEEIFTSSQTRALPTVENAEILDMVVIDQIIANVIYDHFSTGSSIETLLREAHIAICKYCEKKGYPKNIEI